MPAYLFALNDGGAETLGAMELKNDAEAFDFGKSVIRDLANGETASQTLEITEGLRAVGTIPITGVEIAD